MTKDHKDVTTIIIKIIEKAYEPLTLNTIEKNIPQMYRIDKKKVSFILKNLVNKQSLFNWPPKRGKKRFWNKDPDIHSLNKTLEILSNTPLTRTELQNRLQSVMFSCSKSKAEEIRKKNITSLIKEKRIFQLPLLVRQKAARFSTDLPDPALYLIKLKTDFFKICDKLTKAGLTADEIYTSVCEELTPLSLSESKKESSLLNKAGQNKPLNYEEIIIKKIFEIEPDPKKQTLISIEKLRDKTNIPDDVFDKNILILADKGKIWLHRHAYPANAKKKEVVIDKDNYYMGVVIRT